MTPSSTGAPLANSVNPATFFIAMLKVFIVSYRYKIPSEKGPGPVRQFRLYATNLDEASRLATGYANYPNIEVLAIRQA